MTTAHHRRGGRRLQVAALVALTTVLAVTGCGSDNHDDDGHNHGSDDHVVIDPVAEDPAITAKAVAINRFTWDPGTQSGVWDIPAKVVTDSLTGPARDKATDPAGAGAADTPEQWRSWAAAGASMRAIVTDAVVTGDGNDRTVTVTVRQDLEYPDGSASTWKTRPVEIHLVAVDGRWKADSITDTDNTNR